MSSTQPHDPPLSSNPQTTSPSTTSAQPITNPAPSSDFLPSLGTLDSAQLLSLLRHLPGVVNKLSGQGNLKEDAAQTLSNLSQATFQPQQHPQIQHYMPNVSDPGPSSHPRGPPNLGQLGAPAAPNAPPQQTQEAVNASESHPIPEAMAQAPPTNPPAAAGAKNGGSRSRGRATTMGSDEWTRQRKDNHKEVERRRRGNINEGINELGRIVPNGSGEKAKGAVLSRAVQYIHHLKENEARNIEKWTLEKLLMDQAMNDLKAQYEEAVRAWGEERTGRQTLQAELDVLRGLKPGSSNAAPQTGSRSKTPDDGVAAASKRRGNNAPEDEEKEKDEGRAKRQRVDKSGV